MEVERLAAFLALSEELNFRRAAERLHVATSPLSRYIRDLEAELGVRLFDRGTRHVRLTGAGAALIPHAQEILASMSAATRAVRSASGEPVALALGVRVLSPAFQREIEQVLATARPASRIHAVPLESSVQVRQILSGELDIGILLVDALPAALGSRPLMRETMGIAMPDTPANRALPLVRPRHLAQLRMIAIGSSQDVPTVAVRSIGGDYHRESLGSVPGLDIIPGGIRSMIASGGYCAFVSADPASPWNAAILGEGVVLRPLPASFPKPVTAAVWRRSRTAPDDMGEFIGALRRAFPAPVEL
ncbi:MAG: hypothetical protein JWN61_3114 [Pseudonocardiales bacterium]|nr:hypothetical protein [Pseudonocardiales bacterium]